ncbi:MAG: VOC family protein [Ahrensia sp.]|nr:VOC family protein [Ahrensia sp.]
MTASLDHVALTVSDRERSAAFYGRYFGYSKRVHEDDHLLILAATTPGYLALSEGDVPPQPPRTTHFGFSLPSPSDVLELRERFRADGVKEAEWQDQGTVRVQIFDPDGYRVDAYSFGAVSS